MPTRRDQPYIWATWLAPLLAGMDSCTWKVWQKAHFSNLNKRIDPNFDSAEWKERHTALLNRTRDEYKAVSRDVSVEREWRIEGKTATVAGKIDLVVFEPNIVIDCKTGKPKDSDATQVRIYLLAIQLGGLPSVQGPFKGVLSYPEHEINVPELDARFKERFFAMVRSIADNNEPRRVPSSSECRFCDIADCPQRVTKAKPVRTDRF